MKKKLVINETQLKRILEFQSNDDTVDVAKKLKNLPCTGDSIKTLVFKELGKLGFKDVKVNFIGHEDGSNNLMYSIYTEGPMFVIKAQSSKSDKPCLDIVYVQPYDKS
tara:strand:+ start:698 stop:1021 length:324 start_codon:yes stop_codon:yes gene_type:complete